MHIDFDYYRSFNLVKEPFSSSPDPDFFYQSRQHFGALQQLEHAIKTQAGLNLVIGAPGTGKTTLFKHLYKKLKHEEHVSLFSLTGRVYENSSQFDEDILSAFGVSESSASTFEPPYEMLYRFLAEQVGEKKKTVTLLIDDGHLIPECCFESLTKLSGYQLNGKQLVQIVIFAGRDFMANLSGKSELENSIKNYRTLGPLSFADTKNMISYRLKIAGNTIIQNPLFTYPGIVAIYLATGGYPLKIVKLCHRCIVSMIVRKSMKSGWFHVRSNARRVLADRKMIPDMVVSVFMFLMPLLAIILVLGMMDSEVITKFPPSVEQTEHGRIETKSVQYPGLSEREDNAEEILSLTAGKESQVADTVTVDETSPGPDAHLVKLMEGVEKDGARSTETYVTEKPLAAFPDIIGSVEVKRGDTLLIMLERVYGHSRPRYRTPVVEKNKHLSNINSLEIGDMINFPPIDAQIDASMWGKGAYWIKVASKESLNDAFDFLRDWPAANKKIKLIPYFHPGNGLTFDIIVKAFFTDYIAADGMLETLSGEEFQNGEVVQFTQEDTVYFANPFY